MKRLRLSPAALLVLAACGTQRHTPADYYAILPDIVRFTADDARKTAGGRPADGPLWVDDKSFAGGGWQLTGKTLNRDSVVAAMGTTEARAVTPPQVIMLQDTGATTLTPDAVMGTGGGRWVREYGVLLHMNQVKWDHQEVAATVTSYATDRSVWPTNICRRVWRLTYSRPQGTWKRTKEELRKRCQDPD